MIWRQLELSTHSPLLHAKLKRNFWQNLQPQVFQREGNVYFQFTQVQYHIYKYVTTICFGGRSVLTHLVARQ